MKHSIKSGLGFGLTSGIITTLGLLIGLSVSTDSKSVVLAGIITIAVADALSDSLGIHISQEAEGEHSSAEIWQTTIVTFMSKLIFASTFVVPVMIFSLQIATILSVIWAIILLGIFSYYISLSEKTAPWKVISEHLAIALLVVFFSYLIGNSINSLIK